MEAAFYFNWRDIISPSASSASAAATLNGLIYGKQGLCVVDLSDGFRVSTQTWHIGCVENQIDRLQCPGVSGGMVISNKNTILCLDLGLWILWLHIIWWHSCWGSFKPKTKALTPERSSFKIQEYRYQIYHANKQEWQPTTAKNKRTGYALLSIPQLHPLRIFFSKTKTTSTSHKYGPRSDLPFSSYLPI